MRNLTDLQDIIENCVSKIAFIEDFAAGCDQSSKTEKGSLGLFFILHDLQDDLNFINSEIYEMRHKGMIIEKEEAN